MWTRTSTVLAVMLTVVVGVSVWVAKRDAPGHSAIYESSLTTHLSEGDVIFRKGKGRWSPFFAASNPASGFSHVGVIEKDQDGFHVLHAEADDIKLIGGVLKTPLKQFIEESEFFEIKRNTMSAEQRHTFMEELRRSWLDKIPFDSDFSLKDKGEKVYCTELVWLASQRAGAALGAPIHLAGIELITVDSIYSSRFLTPSTTRYR